MKQLTIEQYNDLTNEIYLSLINNPDFGMGEIGDCKSEAVRVVDDWMKKFNIELIEPA